MQRRNFQQVLSEAKINLRKEYDRLYYMFIIDNSSGYSIYQLCDNQFYKFPFKGTCLSLADFNETHKFIFEQYPTDFDINYLINFCEYCYNLGFFLGIQNMFEQIHKVMDLINYKQIRNGDGPISFVEKDAAAISVSEITPQKIAYETLEYNHYSLKGDIEKKKNILISMAEYIEPKSKELQEINKTLKNSLFYMFNNYNIRHNNKELGSNFNPILEKISNEQLEALYDLTYQLWLFSVLTVDNTQRLTTVKKIKELQEQQKKEVNLL